MVVELHGHCRQKRTFGADFTARFPAISVELMLNERIVDMVEEGFDVAVRCELLSDSSLIARQLAPCRLVVCGAPSYFEKHGVPRAPADLTTHNCLTMAGADYPITACGISRRQTAPR